MGNTVQPACGSFEEVMRSYTPMVYRIAFTRLGDRADAEDVTQDVFFRYFKASPKVESEEHRKAWLIHCAVNCANSFAKTAWHRHRASGEALENMSEEPLSGDFTDDIATKSEVMAAVMKLPPKHRTAIHLFYFEDMSISQISRVMGAGENTVKSWLNRAREQLKTMLTEVDF